MEVEKTNQKNMRVNAIFIDAYVAFYLRICDDRMFEHLGFAERGHL